MPNDLYPVSKVVTSVDQVNLSGVYNCTLCPSTAPTYENIKVDVVGAKKNVGIIQLNRPKALNALCKPLFEEIGKAVKDFDADTSISAIIITGK